MKDIQDGGYEPFNPGVVVSGLCVRGYWFDYCRIMIMVGGVDKAATVGVMVMAEVTVEGMVVAMVEVTDE